MKPFPFLLAVTLISLSTRAQQPPVEPKGQYVIVNNHRIWYHRFGHGDPILFIPGGPGAAHHFWPDMNGLAKSFEVIYYDPFGRGQSDTAKDVKEYTFEHDVDEVEALRIALNLRKVNIYGKSYGSVVAQAYALKYPNSISHLILAAAFHSAEMWQANDDNSNQEIRNQYPEIGRRLDSLHQKGYVSSDSLYLAIAAPVNDGLLYYYNPNNNATENFNINWKLYYQLAGRDADVTLGGDLANIDFRPRLKEITVPTLIIAGRFDRVSIPRYALQYKELMPAARFVMFEKSGHHPSIEEPELHDKIVRDFLRDRK
ncbi:MAG: proline iminopeptidase-family hydrolase [Bacteroidetes bacterium]|nr:proline iminopeptidase-family hydrolase [Bacteroidota bacterium]